LVGSEVVKVANPPGRRRGPSDAGFADAVVVLPERVLRDEELAEVGQGGVDTLGVVGVQQLGGFNVGPPLFPLFPPVGLQLIRYSSG
jgi:hypothetical protein